MALWLTCCKCRRESPVKDWYQGRRKGGRPHDLDQSPRLGTGRPPDASKTVTEKALTFIRRYGVSKRAFCRAVGILLIRFDRAAVGLQHLPMISEKMIEKSLSELALGKRWLRRKLTDPAKGNRWRWDFERVDYHRACPMGALYCAGSILPGDCPRRWWECPFGLKGERKVEPEDWRRAEKAHGVAKDEVEIRLEKKKTKWVAEVLKKILGP